MLYFDCFIVFSVEIVNLRRVAEINKLNEMKIKNICQPIWRLIVKIFIKYLIYLSIMLFIF